MKHFFLAALVCFVAVPAWAATSIEVTDAWTRAIPGTAGAAYLTIANHGTNEDRLVSISSPIAAMAELHETAEQNGVATMRPATPIILAKGAVAKLKPRGTHIMLMGLTHPLVAGETFPLTLTFEKAGAVSVAVAVEKASAPDRP